MTKSRLLSLLVAIGYLVLAYYFGGGPLALRVAAFLILPLACIWFSEEMGSYTGIAMGRGAITETTPGCIVAAGGWLVLMLPVIVGLVGAWSQKTS